MRRRSFLACLAAPVLPVTPVLPVAPIGVRWIGVDPAAGPGLCVVSIFTKPKTVPYIMLDFVVLKEGETFQEVVSKL